MDVGRASSSSWRLRLRYLGVCLSAACNLFERQRNILKAWYLRTWRGGATQVVRVEILDNIDSGQQISATSRHRAVRPKRPRDQCV
jgi:hypothetical protein